MARLPLISVLVVFCMAAAAAARDTTAGAGQLVWLLCQKAHDGILIVVVASREVFYLLVAAQYSVQALVHMM